MVRAPARRVGGPRRPGGPRWRQPVACGLWVAGLLRSCWAGRCACRRILGTPILMPRLLAPTARYDPLGPHPFLLEDTWPASRTSGQWRGTQRPVHPTSRQNVSAFSRPPVHYASEPSPPALVVYGLCHLHSRTPRRFPNARAGIAHVVYSSGYTKRRPEDVWILFAGARQPDG